MLTAELTTLNTHLGYFLFRPIKILAVFTACVEFVPGWQHARNYIWTHWADWTWMDRRTKISRISSWKIWQPYLDPTPHQCTDGVKFVVTYTPNFTRAIGETWDEKSQNAPPPHRTNYAVVLAAPRNAASNSGRGVHTHTHAARCCAALVRT